MAQLSEMLMENKVNVPRQDANMLITENQARIINQVETSGHIGIAHGIKWFFWAIVILQEGVTTLHASIH